MHIDDLLRKMVERKASDLHLKAGSPPVLRIDGKLTEIDTDRLSPEGLEKLIFGILKESQKKTIH
jgi:twitching motility protein PilT